LEHGSRLLQALLALDPLIASDRRCDALVRLGQRHLGASAVGTASVARRAARHRHHKCALRARLNQREPPRHREPDALLHIVHVGARHSEAHEQVSDLRSVALDQSSQRRGPPGFRGWGEIENG
jgi:hypothetical protein